MKRIDEIMKNELFVRSMDKIEVEEKDRIYCKHDLSHSLDVARIAYILNLEQKLGISKEMIYAAALLHDVGRYRQYTDGIPHEKASAGIAREILKASGYLKEEINDILDAILLHRESVDDSSFLLGTLLYRADKLSRSCFVCKSAETCHWSNVKKNMQIRY